MVSNALEKGPEVPPWSDIAGMGAQGSAAPASGGSGSCAAVL